jgi:opacity protein-like surface antigen
MCCPNSCFRGNLEFRLELFGGAQFSPSTEWLVGLTPHLRYNFATGTRCVPFIDAGAGVSGTGIGAPDLATTFEFNLQGGAGVQYFISSNISINLEAWYLHMSNAGIKEPNLGVNGITGMLGISFYF